jgi:hypothetical protein
MNNTNGFLGQEVDDQEFEQENVVDFGYYVRLPTPPLPRNVTSKKNKKGKVFVNWLLCTSRKQHKR